MADKKTFSVLIRWNDSDIEQGEFGATVRAVGYEEAERLARIEMRNCHVENYSQETADEYEDDDGTFGGSVIECAEGAIWKANELEAALRGLLAQVDEVARVRGWPDNAPREAARKIIAEIDGL